MKKDNLEKFIEANRIAWDDQRAPAGVWDKIQTDLIKESGYSNPWKTVSIILLVVLSLVIVGLVVHSMNNRHSTLMDSGLEFAELEDFRETEHFYLTSINVNYEKLNRHGIDATLEADLSLLDSNYKELLEEYKTAQGAFKEQVLRAIIQNYKTKLDILEHVLSDLERSKKTNDERIF